MDDTIKLDKCNNHSDITISEIISAMGQIYRSTQSNRICSGPLEMNVHLKKLTYDWCQTRAVKNQTAAKYWW